MLQSEAENEKDFLSLSEELSFMFCLDYSKDDEVKRKERMAYVQGYVQRDIEQHQIYNDNKLDKLFDDVLKYVHGDKEIDETMHALNKVFEYAYRAGFTCGHDL